MNQKVALHIQKLRTQKPRHGWSRIAEVICEQYPTWVWDHHGNPDDLWGDEALGRTLSVDAAKFLKISNEQYALNWL